MERGGTHLVAELRDELLVAREDVRTVLDEERQGPEAQWRLAVLLDDVQVRIVHAPAHLARLLDHRVHPLRERVVEHGQRRLGVMMSAAPAEKGDGAGDVPCHHAEPRSWAG